jgi:hypothetical protein
VKRWAASGGSRKYEVDDKYTAEQVPYTGSSAVITNAGSTTPARNITRLQRCYYLRRKQQHITTSYYLSIIDAFFVRVACRAQDSHWYRIHGFIMKTHSLARRLSRSAKPIISEGNLPVFTCLDCTPVLRQSWQCKWATLALT